MFFFRGSCGACSKSEALDTISQLRVAISDAKDRSQELDSVFKHALESQAIQCRVSAALLAHGTSEVQMLENFLVELAENVDKETTSKNALIEVCSGRAFLGVVEGECYVNEKKALVFANVVP